MNVTRRQIRRATERYETQVRTTGKSSDLEMMLYEALTGLLHGRVLPGEPYALTGLTELDALPVGSIVTTPFGDIEGDVAERASDEYWLVTGEIALYTSENLCAMADAPFTVLRRGYGDER